MGLWRECGCGDGGGVCVRVSGEAGPCLSELISSVDWMQGVQELFKALAWHAYAYLAPMWTQPPQTPDVCSSSNLQTTSIIADILSNGPENMVGK